MTICVLDDHFFVVHTRKEMQTSASFVAIATGCAVVVWKLCRRQRIMIYILCIRKWRSLTSQPKKQDLPEEDDEGDVDTDEEGEPPDEGLN